MSTVYVIETGDYSDSSVVEVVDSEEAALNWVREWLVTPDGKDAIISNRGVCKDATISVNRRDNGSSTITATYRLAERFSASGLPLDDLLDVSTEFRATPFEVYGARH